MMSGPRPAACKRLVLWIAIAAGALAAPLSAARAATPVLDCVDDNMDGTYTAHFGYSSTNPATVTIPVGSNNKFIPDPQDRGQPTAFQLGLHTFVFSVVWDGSTLSWFLDSHTVTATASSTRCSTPTATSTGSATSTATPTATWSATATGTATDTQTPTATFTASASPTASSTPTDTATPIATATDTETATSTPTASPTAAETDTPSATSSATASDTATETATVSVTATATGTPAGTATATLTATAASTPTASHTSVATSTGTVSVTPTATPVPLCARTPVPGCATPVGFKKPFRLGVGRQIAAWRWRTAGDIPVSDFGDPLTATSYALCVYAGAPAGLVLQLDAPAAGTCSTGRPCWKRHSSKGFRYKDHDATPDGVTKLVLRTSVAHLADLVLRARGSNIAFPSMPLDEPVVVQLVRSGGSQCWESDYSAPAMKNTSDAFKDKND